MSEYDNEVNHIFDHNWPTDDGHVWDEWMQGQGADSPGGATQYRKCVHPDCRAYETRKAPMA